MPDLPSISEIDRLHAAATPGTWERECGSVFSRGHGMLMVSVRAFDGDGDLNFVVALRNAWPAISEALNAARAFAKLHREQFPVDADPGGSFLEMEAALSKLAPLAEPPAGADTSGA